MTWIRFARCVCILVCMLPTAAAAGILSGQVTDYLGMPVPGVDIDFEDALTGDNVDAANDGTDALGNYSVLLPPGVYHVTYIPPAGVALSPAIAENIDVNLDAVHDETLPQAWWVTGFVKRGDDGMPEQGVDLDFDDLVTGEKLFTPRDNTDDFGIYNVAVPMGIYEVTFDGKQDGVLLPQLAHGVVEEVCVDGTGTVALPDLTLPLGYFITGEVFSNLGIPVAGADLDFFPAGTSEELFTKGDNTNGSGSYQLIMPAGTYDIEISPPAALPLTSALKTNIFVGADINLGIDVLFPGPQVTGLVRDPGGAPLPLVDLDFTDASSGDRFPTAHDETDAAGQYDVYVAAGVYDVKYEAQRNYLLDEKIVPGVSIPTSTVLPDVTLDYHDDDGDGVADLTDVCPFEPGAQIDLDGDGVGDACDNCAGVSNPRQEDNDLDRIGDACDPDDDNDGILDVSDPDPDGDGVPTIDDNCPLAHNPRQTNSGLDADGDACDDDDGEVEYLEARGKRGFVWRPETGALGYQVYRQRLGWLCSISFGTCYHDVAAGNVFADPKVPESGQGFGYLVTATTAAGEGSLGRGSEGPDRPNLRPCP